MGPSSSPSKKQNLQLQPHGSGFRFKERNGLCNLTLCLKKFDKATDMTEMPLDEC